VDHILNIARQRQQEIDMAQKKLAAPPQEVAQIVVYQMGAENPVMVRYHDMKEAQKQFSKLLEAADHAKPIVLTSAAMTAAFRHPQNIAVAYLVNVESNNFLMCDSQKRMNAIMQAP
jgi:predicted membrane channel-forming protein YqfA (hemolysin III family)